MTARARLAVGLAIALVFSAALAGCSALPEDSDGSSRPPEFDSIQLNNEHDEPHALDVVVTENESVVYWTRVELNASHATDDGTRVAPSERLDPSALGDRGDYGIQFRLDDAATGERVALREYLTGSCTGWYVEIEDDGRLDYGVTCG